MSHEILDIAEAKPVYGGEGNMNDTDMRGVAALPGSMAISRTKGEHRNLGNPIGASGKLPEGGIGKGKPGASARAEMGWRSGA
jgi:hypothetical protein